MAVPACRCNLNAVEPVEFFAYANLSLQGQTIAFHATAWLLPTDEVLSCVRLGYLVGRDPATGEFPGQPDPEPARCCGG